MAILLFAVSRCYIALVLDPPITDKTLYFEYASRALDRHKTPYSGFEVEYPPVAWWSICAPRLLDERRMDRIPYSPINSSIIRDYYRTYRFEMALFDVASFALFLAIVRKRSPRSAGLAALAYVVTSTILCHVLYDHLDEGVLLFTMLGLYAWTRSLAPGRSAFAWSGAAFFFFGLGFAYKVVPIIAIPFLLLEEWRSSDRWKRMAAGFSGLVLGMGGPFAIQYAISGPDVFKLFAHHAGREIQVESLYSTLMWFGSFLGHPISIALKDGAYCVSGDWASIMKWVSTVVLCGFLAAAWLGAAVRESRFGREAILGLACYALGASVIFSKVLSPQYFVWSIPLLLLAVVDVLPERSKSAWLSEPRASPRYGVAARKRCRDAAPFRRPAPKTAGYGCNSPAARRRIP